MMQVRKSINIKYDSKNTSLINEYYATSSHSEIIRHVFSGILGGNTRAHIAYGPYGAGKSFISTILTGFTSQKYHNNDIRDFIAKFKK
jgi:Fe-S cluster assembly ATPase SufC